MDTQSLFFKSRSFFPTLQRTLRYTAFMAIIVGSVGIAQKLDMGRFENMKPRRIGPAAMSGRVTAIDAAGKDPEIIYIGSASGGVWKSRSGGVTWEPVFDTMAVASIGAIAIDQRTPDVVWIGTGEGNPRNSQNSGDGVYKTLDGGKNWIHLGLDNTRNIHRLLLDPRNPEVAYVGALGSAWADTPDRGVYKTTDGGRTWQKILYVNERTGVADIVMDPTNPNKLVAAMWEYRRWPWFFKSGGPGSGIYVTVDGGQSWKKRSDEDGLPKGELGRVGLAIAPSNPDRIYALVETKKNALYRSDDGGVKWTKISDKDVGDRPFYYAECYVDPNDDNRLYYLHSTVTESQDGGKTFETLIPYFKIHGDHHAFWISKTDPNLMMDGNDGGAAISRDHGKTWSYITNLPLGQFYHVNVDNEMPYNIYGGLQDNGSWRGPAYLWQWDAIRNQNWEMVSWGDGFDVAPDRTDPRICYSMSQGGYLLRHDNLTGDNKFIRPIHPKGIELRFNWNAGLATDPLSPGTIYYGSQFLHKSTNRGDSWEIISPDLTTNDTTKQRQLESGGLTYDVTAAENYCTIITIAPSPVQKGVIWVGTDDGNVQVTTNGGTTWTNVVKNIKGVPDSTWVPQIQASTYNAGEAFVVFDNHRKNDWTPYVYRTTNYGESWTRLVDPKSVRGFALSFVQDPVEPMLMFLGTEFGLHVSIDGGATWTKWTQGYPTVSTMDMAIQPTESDLVIGTFGRAIYVLDDIRPLRELARKGTKLLDEPLHIFDIPDALEALYRQGPPGPLIPGDADFAGENRTYGARISFSITPPDTSSATKKGAAKDSTFSPDSIKVDVFSAKNELLRTFKEKVKKGMNRVLWGLDRRGERWPSQPKPEPGAPEPGGYSVLPGTYRVRLTYGPHADSASVVVKADPRSTISLQDMEANYAMLEQLLSRVHTATDAADRLREAKKRMEQIAGLIKERTDSTAKKVKDLGTALQDSIKKLDEMIDDREVQGIRNDPSLLQSKLQQASSYVTTTWEAPGESQRIAVAQAVGSLKKLADAVNKFFETNWSKYETAVDAAQIKFFEPYVPIKVDQ